MLRWLLNITGWFLDGRELAKIAGGSLVTSGVISTVVEQIRSLPTPILISVISGMAILLFVGFSYLWDTIKKRKGLRGKNGYANIQVTPRVVQNLAVIDVINSGVDANFTATARVVKGIPPKTSYNMCWDSPPHLEHPIKKRGKSIIIVAEKISAIAETPDIVANGLAIYRYGISGVEKVGATTQELSDQVKLNIMYPTMAKPIDDSCTLEITITSTPPLPNASENRKYIVKIDHEQGHKLLILPLLELETHIELDLVKLFHDGKDVHSKLKRAQNNTDTNEQVTAQLYFETWFSDVTKSLKNTNYEEIWYANEVVDYKRDQIPEYLSASVRALERLESIIKLISHREGSQP